MEQFFGFRNFRQFERSRREIRLPYDLLKDLRFRQLPDASKAHLIWCCCFRRAWTTSCPITR
jgi:hypothetical protein